jgi:5-methyltetrahydropteroyltriglutamate--homocysteine methyltransferase
VRGHAADGTETVHVEESMVATRATGERVFRAETVGSMLRPAYLKRAQADFARGTLTADELTRLEDRAVDEAIALQESVGLNIVTDGEMRRRDFMAPLYEGVDGTEATPGRPLRWKHVRTGDELVWHIPFIVTGKLQLSLVPPPVVDAFVYARDRARRPVKQSLPSPLLANWGWNAEVLGEVYSDPFALLVDATAVVRRLAQELSASGCTYIQIDAPDVAALADRSRGDTHPASGIPIQQLLTEGLDLLNTIPEGISDVTFGIHLCRGNIRSHYATSGSYAQISQQLFSRLTRYDTFLLEYDDERAGGFEALADCPDDKTVVLGLISSKLPELEDAEAIAHRVDEAAGHHPRERLAISTQCGFATEAEGNQLTVKHQRAKLELVADLAQRLWP